MSLTRADGRVLLSMAGMGLLAIFYGLFATDHPANNDFLAQIQNQTTLLVVTDLNRATYTELLSIPGIGPTLAQRILEQRMLSGPISHWEELDQVRGIGPATLKKIRATPGVCLASECNNP